MMIDKFKLSYNSYLNCKIESEFSLNKHELLLNYVSHLCSKEEEYLISASSVKREKDSEDEVRKLRIDNIKNTLELNRLNKE